VATSSTRGQGRAVEGWRGVLSSGASADAPAPQAQGRALHVGRHDLHKLLNSPTATTCRRIIEGAAEVRSMPLQPAARIGCSMT